MRLLIAFSLLLLPALSFAYPQSIKLDGVLEMQKSGEYEISASMTLKKQKEEKVIYKGEVTLSKNGKSGSYKGEFTLYRGKNKSVLYFRTNALRTFWLTGNGLEFDSPNNLKMTVSQQYTRDTCSGAGEDRMCLPSTRIEDKGEAHFHSIDMTSF